MKLKYQLLTTVLVAAASIGAITAAPAEAHHRYRSNRARVQSLNYGRSNYGYSSFNGPCNYGNSAFYQPYRQPQVVRRRRRYNNRERYRDNSGVGVFVSF